jgi:hypothetical protein
MVIVPAAAAPRAVDGVSFIALLLTVDLQPAQTSSFRVESGRGPFDKRRQKA